MLTSLTAASGDVTKTVAVSVAQAALKRQQLVTWTPLGGAADRDDKRYRRATPFCIVGWLGMKIALHKEHKSNPASFGRQCITS